LRISEAGLRAAAGRQRVIAGDPQSATRDPQWGNPQSAIRNPQLGVTLIEMLVVVAIIAIAGAIVLPGVTTGLENLKLRTTAERLGNTFRFARETALRRQVICQVTVDPQRRTVALEQVSAERGPASAAGTRSWEMPAGIQVRLERARAFVFAPGGGPNISLTLVNSRGRAALVELDVLTGLPRVSMP
jgi:general secretion pathway protein H